MRRERRYIGLMGLMSLMGFMGLMGLVGCSMIDEDQSAGAEWSDDIKPFVKAVIEAIRENDEDTIIIVGTPKTCFGISTAADSELDYSNIAYACRFFAGTQGEEYREDIESAIDDGLCVFPMIVTSVDHCEAQGAV